MLHRTMNASAYRLRLALEDILGDLGHARRTGDLGRVALLLYCELRGWARWADLPVLAGHAHALFLGAPYADRASFLARADALIAEAQQALQSISDADHGCDSTLDDAAHARDGFHGRAPLGLTGR